MSGRFRFPLDSALQQRVRQEQAIQLKLAQQLQARAVAQVDLDRIEQALRAEERRSSPYASAFAPGAALHPEDRLSLLFYLDQAKARVQQQRQLVQQCDKAAAAWQAQLLQASVQRRALERLRERRVEAFRNEEQRRADQQLDEYVTVRYTRSAE